VGGSLESQTRFLSTFLDEVFSKPGTLSPPELDFPDRYRLLPYHPLSAKSLKPGKSLKNLTLSSSNQSLRPDQATSQILIPVVTPQQSSSEIRKVLIHMNKTT